MKKKIFWAFITVILAILTLKMLFSKSGLSVDVILQTITNASPVWLVAALVCMIAYILFEGEALVLILRTLGYPVKHHKGFLYSAADLYFSSITPSASGGQPASAYFMHKDGIPGFAVTASLIMNVTMYTVAIVTLGVFSVAFFPGVFTKFNLPCKLMILFGIFMMSLLTLFFIMLLKNQKILRKTGSLIVALLKKIRLNKAASKFNNRIDSAIENYNDSVSRLSGKKRFLFKFYLLNLFQRAAQILVTVFAFYALGGKLSDGLFIFVVQTYVVLGSNFIPIPGAIGISEYIMFFGYMMIMDSSSAYHLEFISRGISFYLCSIVSLFTVILGYIFLKTKKVEVQK